MKNLLKEEIELKKELIAQLRIDLGLPPMTNSTTTTATI